MNTIISCPHCKYKGEGKAGRSTTLNFLFLIAGFFTYGIAWLAWFVYCLNTKVVICPKCDYKNVIKK